MSFFATMGRLPMTWPVLSLMVVSGLCEGFGIALFAPVLELVGDGGGSWILAWLTAAFSFLGLPVELPVVLAVITLLLICAFAINYLQARLLINAYFRKTTELRTRLFKSTYQAEWGYLSLRAHGEVVSQLITECLRYGQTLMFQVRIVATFALVAVYAAVGISLSWKLLLLVLALGCAFAMLLRPLFRKAKRLGDETTKANRDLSFHTVDFLRGAKLIKVTAAENAVSERFASFAEAAFRVMFNTESMNEFTYFVLHVLLATTIATIIFVADQTLNLDVAVMMTFLLIMARMMPRLAQLQQHYQQYLIRRPAIPLIDGILDSAAAAQEIVDDHLTRFACLEQGIRLDGVGFRYPGGNGPALDHVALDIPRHKMVALVGSSGSGKSTVIDMLAGLRQPDDGAVLIDGRDLREINLSSWRYRIGYVTQDTTIFNDTVRNNLLFAHPEAEETDIAECLRAAHLTSVIDALPSGLDTVLGEAGVILSGGERQRLALARALIGKPELLLLDEATSALDNESERIVQQAIEDISREMTVLVVAHRLSTVRKADIIYVIEDGRIVETGAYADLVAQGGRFAVLHEMQFG